jgi:hypothetical protein
LAGIQRLEKLFKSKPLDSRFHGNDKKRYYDTACFAGMTAKKRNLNVVIQSLESGGKKAGKSMV